MDVAGGRINATLEHTLTGWKVIPDNFVVKARDVKHGLTLSRARPTIESIVVRALSREHRAATTRCRS
jgi:hypothetical protein